MIKNAKKKISKLTRKKILDIVFNEIMYFDPVVYEAKTMAQSTRLFVADLAELIKPIIAKDSFLSKGLTIQIDSEFDFCEIAAAKLIKENYLDDFTCVNFVAPEVAAENGEYDKWTYVYNTLEAVLFSIINNTYSDYTEAISDNWKKYTEEFNFEAYQEYHKQFE